MGLLLLLARGYVLEPHEQGNIVLEVFGGYAAVGAEETPDVHVHGVDVLQVLIASDLHNSPIKFSNHLDISRKIRYNISIFQIEHPERKPTPWQKCGQAAQTA